MSSHVLPWGILRWPLHLTAAHRPAKVLCPSAAFAAGPNKVKKAVAQKLSIFPCPLCLLFFFFPWAAFSVLPSPGLCSPTLTPALSCQRSLVASPRVNTTAAEGPETSPKRHIFLSSLQSLPPLPWRSITGHSSALPGPPPGTHSPARSSVPQPFFWGTSSPAIVFLSFAPHQVWAHFVPSAQPLLGTRQLFNGCLASLLGLLISSDTRHGSFGITTFSLSFFSRIRLFHMRHQANPNLILPWPTAEPKYAQVSPPKHRSPPGLHNRQVFDTVS